MNNNHPLNPLSYGRRLERKFRSWRKRLPFRFQQWRIARAYATFDVAAALQACRRQPLYSLVVPVYRTDPQWLRRCIASVRGQLYPRWELILVDDGSQSPTVTEELQRWAARDHRIRTFALPSNGGISRATNHGLAQARGEFVGLLDHDDELTPDALLWMVVAHNRNPRSRWFYTDEAVLELDGNYAGRFHRKPAFSWEYLLSVMYCCHFTVYERDFLETVGGMRPEVDGAQDHDLALRVSEHITPEEVTHIPQMLYLWRAIPQSTAHTLDSKPEAAGAAYRAVQEAVARRGLPCRVTPDADIPTLFHLELRPRTRPKVAIVIPTRNASAMLRRCVDSLRANTEYPNYEVVVIDNQSDEPELARYLNELGDRIPARTLRYDQPFNHSDMHNQVISGLDAELIVLANNDVYDFSPRWLEQFVATTQLDESIAGAGGKLFYPDGTIQHAGVVIGVADGLAGNVWCGAPGSSCGYLGRARSLQQVAAVTGALMIVKKSAYLEVGGFDAQRYPTSYNDVDLWIRLGAAGYRCLFNPEVQAFHEESKSRGVSENELEYQRRMREDFRRRGYRDPFWNLALFDNPSKVRRDERTAQWALNKLDALRHEVQTLMADNRARVFSFPVSRGRSTSETMRPVLPARAECHPAA
jgi:O-antigen biosynthesis protein